MIFFIGGLLKGIGKVAGIVGKVASIASNPASLLDPNNMKDVLSIFDGDSKKTEQTRDELEKLDKDKLIKLAESLKGKMSGNTAASFSGINLEGQDKKKIVNFIENAIKMLKENPNGGQIQQASTNKGQSLNLYT